jgi:hypothetical protein
MNADSPRDGQDNQGFDHGHAVLLVMGDSIQDVEDNRKVDGKIAVQHKDIPCQEGSGPVHGSEKRQNVPDPVGTADVDHDEHNAH